MAIELTAPPKPRAVASTRIQVEGRCHHAEVARRPNMAPGQGAGHGR